MLASMSPKPRREHGRIWTPGQADDTVDGMTWGQVELEPEAHRAFVGGIKAADFALMLNS